MKMRLLSNAVVYLAAMILFACGGGGGGTVGGGGTSGGDSTTGGSDTTPVVPAPVFKAGILTIGTASTAQLPAGTTINGIDMTITLPAGVTVKADAASGAADPTILALSGTAASLPNSIVSGKYDKTANTLHVILANVQPGFAAGEFMRVNFDGFPASTATFAVVLNQVSGGTDPKAAPVTLTGVTATSAFAGSP